MAKNPLSIKARADAKRTPVERFADRVATLLGSITFLILNIALFIVWLLINTGNFGGVPIFDPFPFNLLSAIVSLEAIILAIFVLISENRSIKIDDLREEIHLQINIIAEREITKTMQMLALLLEKNGVDLSRDPELKKLLKPTSEEAIEHKLKKEILKK